MYAIVKNTQKKKPSAISTSIKISNRLDKITTVIQIINYHEDYF
jgi:hypothetical protein